MRIALSAASLLAALVLLAALPYVVGVNWSQIGNVIGQLDPVTVLWLGVLWLVSLWAYTFVLTTALPGLTHWHAFLLNATGSSISNVLPFGGAAGVAITYAMCRSWGHRASAIMVSVLVSGLWNLLVKLLLPAVGIGALLIAGQVPDRRLDTAALLGCVLLLGIVAAVALALSSERAAERLQKALLKPVRRMPARLAGPWVRMASSVLRLRRLTTGVLRTGWKQLTAGMFAYVSLQCLLFAGCLWAAGAFGGPAGLSTAEVIAVFALNRVLTTAVVTPGGTGISETGTAALLIHLGAPAAPATTAVFLYMLFTHTLEIPLGGLAGAWWALTRGRKRPEEHRAAQSTNLAQL